MARNTAILSICPWNISAPGPEAVSTTSAAECTPAYAKGDKFPILRAAPGAQVLFQSLEPRRV
jgi:hypothetical protein